MKKLSTTGSYMATLEAVYTTLLEKEIKEDVSILNNIEKITNMVKDLREFTVKYVNENVKED